MKDATKPIRSEPTRKGLWKKSSWRWCFLEWWSFRSFICSPTCCPFVGYTLPISFQMFGPLLIVPTLWLFDIREGHHVVDMGVYKYAGHPMYTAIWFWCLVQALLLNNHIAGQTKQEQEGRTPIGVRPSRAVWPKRTHWRKSPGKHREPGRSDPKVWKIEGPDHKSGEADRHFERTQQVQVQPLIH